MDTWYIDETFNKDGTTTFCAVLFDSRKSKIVKSKLRKIVKKRVPIHSNEFRSKLLSEIKLFDIKRTGNKKLLEEIINEIKPWIMKVEYRTIKYQKFTREREPYIRGYSEFIKTLGTKQKIIIDKCDDVKFSDDIVDKTNNMNVSWANSKEVFGIQLADIMLFEKT